MEATEPKSVDEVADMLTARQEQAEETPAELDEAPDEDQTEPNEVEVEADDEDEATSDDAESTDDEDETEANDEDDDEDEAGLDKFHTVKVDGEERQIPYDELVRGYAGQEYVQKRMGENAQKAKELEAQVHQFQTERQAVLQAYQSLQSGNIMSPPEPPTVDADADPIGWMQEQARYQSQMSEFQQQQANFQQLETQNAAQSQQQRDVYLQEQRQKAVDIIPELRDAEKAPKVVRGLIKAAMKHGFTEAEVQGAMDARLIGILNDAARYQALQESKASGSKKVVGARPVLKPGAKKSQSPKGDLQKAKARMKATGSVDDVAAFLNLKG